MNGAWLEGDAAWGSRGAPTDGRLTRQRTSRGVAYVVVGAWHGIALRAPALGTMPDPTGWASLACGGWDPTLRTVRICILADYPEGDRVRVMGADNSLTSTHQLALAYCAGLQPELANHTTRPLMWPLYSNQPSFNDAAFLRSLLPFHEEVEYNAPGMCTRHHALEAHGKLPLLCLRCVYVTCMNMAPFLSYPAPLAVPVWC